MVLNQSCWSEEQNDLKASGSSNVVNPQDKHNFDRIR